MSRVVATWPSLPAHLKAAILSLIGPALLVAAFFLIPSRAAAVSPEPAPVALPLKVEAAPARKPLVRVWPVAPLFILTLAGVTWAAPAGSSKGAGRRLLLFTAAAVPLAAVALVLCCREGPRPRVAPDWTPQRLRDELERAGVVYEGREIDPDGGRSNPGYYLRAAGRALPWDALTADPRMVPEGMRGCVVVLTPGSFSGDEPGRVRLGHFVLIGDPAELRRILEALGD